jgi:hypothetical protein
MALIIFDDKSAPPSDEAVAEALGRTSKLWNDLKAELRAQFDPLAEKWGFSGAQWGWSLSLKHKKRSVLYLSPRRRHFLASMAFGDKAVQAAHRSDLPREVLEMIDSATKYVEGRAVRIEVRSKKDLVVVTKLIAIKMAT